jgi:hypothetical protein
MEKFFICFVVGVCVVMILSLMLNPLALLAAGLAVAGCSLVGAVVLAIASKLEKEE